MTEPAILITPNSVANRFAFYIYINKVLKYEPQDFFAVRTGLEPVTPCVTGMYSNQLN
jgi:hypothetical protein